MSTHSRLWSVLTVLGLATLMVILLVSEAARAAGPWYVAPGGSDGDSCLDAGSACATINGAIGKATSGDTIYVATGTYTSSTGSEVVLIDRNATLSGGWDASFATQSGMSTIDGQSARRGITLNGGVTATLERFVIQNGYTDSNGGGIANHGTLVLNNSTVHGNATSLFGRGGGIYSTGSLTVNNSTVSNNTSPENGGGGIYNGGALTLTQSTVSGNTGQFGAGVRNNNPATITVTHTTISGNTGSGIYNFGTITLTNTTVSGNLVGSGLEAVIYNFNGTVMLNNSTVSSNTSQSNGAIYNQSGSVTLQNSILAGNTVGGTVRDCTGVISSSGYNLIGSTTFCTFNATTGDLVNLNPRLFALLGSPGYHPLLPWSPAINAGNPAGCTDHLGNPLPTDQRGVGRVGICDMGAYEYDPANDPLTYAFLPLLTKPRPGINGVVTLNGSPIAGVSLELFFYNGTDWSTLITTTTEADGGYSFENMPGLGFAQKYYVRYSNSGGTPGRLWVWGTRELTSYLAGSSVEIGDFDIADIALVSPADGVTVSLPRTFEWTPRPATPSDTYEFDLYDRDDGDPYFFTDPPLGYVDSYILDALPVDFNTGVEYGWEVWVYSLDGGYGISYETRGVTFSNAGLGVRPVSRPKILPEREERRMPRMR